MRIRSSLILLVIAVLLPTVLGAALGVGYIYREQQTAYRTSIQETSRAMALVVEREFARRETLLNTLAESPSLENREFERFHRYARNLVPTVDQAILLHDVSGRTILNTRLPFGTSDPPPHPTLGKLRQLSTPEATIVSDVFFAPVGKESTFAVQVPVMQDGRVAYYLSLSSSTRLLQPILEELKLPEGWFGTILDRDGFIAARTHESERFVGRQTAEDARKFMRENPEGFFDATTLGGIPVTAFITHAPRSGWVFMIGVPRHQLQQTAIRVTMIMIGIATLMIGLAVAFAFFVGRRIAQPMESLRMSTAKLREGTPVAVQRSGILEIDAVNEEMARASQEIRDTRSELENRIAEAVANAERSQRALLQAQKLEALGRLTGGIAHDFNNVLQTLTTGLQLAYFSSVEPRIKNSLEVCQRAVDRATELVRQLMAFGRVQEAHMATVTLSQKVKDMMPMLKGAMRGDIQLQLDLADDIWPVTIDPLQFELALLNLSINARDAMPGRGTLRIGVRNHSLTQPAGELLSGDFVEVSVIDSGEGMKPEVLAKALDPFFTTKDVGKGTGLGLAQVYGFVKQAGGDVAIESKPAKGTTIKLFLPRADIAASPVMQHKTGQGRPASLNARILLVDDDPLVLDVVKPALEAAGLVVRVAQNGDEALALLEAGELFDVVLSDIVMPGRINGIALAGIIDKRFPRTRVVLATGYSSQSPSIPGVRILAKPYGVHEAVEALRSEL